MARYTGPKTKIARRFRDPIFGPDKALERRSYGPGQHGPSKRRGGKQSEYAISYQVKPGDVVGVREKSKSLEAIVSSLDASSKKYDWLDWDRSTMSGRFLSIPGREMIPENIKEQLIVELYSK